MLEARVYKLLLLAAFLTCTYLGMDVRAALTRTGAVVCFVFVSDWLTSFVVP